MTYCSLCKKKSGDCERSEWTSEELFIGALLRITHQDCVNRVMRRGAYNEMNRTKELRLQDVQYNLN